MGALATTPQNESTGCPGGPMPGTVEWMDIERQQEIQWLKNRYDKQFRLLQDGHKKEKRALMRENEKLKNDNRVLKIMNTKLKRNYSAMSDHEADLQCELQRVKCTMRELQEDKNVDIIEKRHRGEKRFLTEEISELRDYVRCLKVSNNNLKKDRERMIEFHEELQEEVQSLRVANNKLQKRCGKVMETEVKLQVELAQVKAANENLNKCWESAMKDCEEEKKILVIRNQELQKELESFKTKVAVQTSVGSSAQLSRHCGVGAADEEKVSINNFQFVRRLGEGAFGTVVLAKGKLCGRSEQLYAIKTLKKRNITSNNICEIMAEKEALILTTGHAFITTLYASFQDKGHIFFVMEYMSGGNLKEQLDEVEVFSEKRAKFYAAEITLAVQFLHQHGILHRDLKLENVLVGSDGHCKIADFGLSKLGLFSQCQARTQCGTPFCMAPEILKNLRYGKGVDWWAVGVMIFEMIAGYPPFYYDEEEASDSGRAQGRLDQKILNDEVNFPEDMSLAAISIVAKLLKKNPAKRLGSNGSVETVRQQAFFKGIDWKALGEKRVKPPEKEKVAKETFSKVLKISNTSRSISGNLYEGFSFVNYGVKIG